VANTTLQLHAGALLHDVRGLVRGGMQIGGLRKCNAITGGVRVGAHRSGTLGGRTTDVCAHVAHVVVAEHVLDAVAMRKAGTRTARAVGRRGVHSRAVGSFSSRSRPLNRRRTQCLGQRTLPRRNCRRARFSSLGSRPPSRHSIEAHEHLPWGIGFYVNRAVQAMNWSRICASYDSPHTNPSNADRRPRSRDVHRAATCDLDEVRRYLRRSSDDERLERELTCIAGRRHTWVRLADFATLRMHVGIEQSGQRIRRP
jgi:hypothetical protein